VSETKEVAGGQEEHFIDTDGGKDTIKRMKLLPSGVCGRITISNVVHSVTKSDAK
jgi:hypothetical protein